MLSVVLVMQVASARVSYSDLTADGWGRRGMPPNVIPPLEPVHRAVARRYDLAFQGGGGVARQGGMIAHLERDDETAWILYHQ